MFHSQGRQPTQDTTPASPKCLIWSPALAFESFFFHDPEGRKADFKCLQWKSQSPGMGGGPSLQQGWLPTGMSCPSAQELQEAQLHVLHPHSVLLKPLGHLPFKQRKDELKDTSPNMR